MIVVFTGPTISPEEARAIFDAGVRWLGPVSQGDVYRASLERPQAIAIIDGYFEHVPSVWHKEILYALSEGIHVFGSSSMGALRAAELERFGMIGAGRIFEAFRDGVLEDDDEVAVAHGPAESGYRSASIAMVDIRATLDAAAARGLVTESTRRELVHLAKSTFYAQRSFPSLVERARAAGLEARELDAFAAALPAIAVEQKKLDAQELLRVLAAFAASPPPPKQVSFHFHHTEVWDQVSRRLGRQQLNLGKRVQSALLLDELRARGPDHYALARTATQFRALALDYARSAGVDAGIERDARVKYVEALFEADVERHLEEELRARGVYEVLSRRALDKQARLAAEGLANPALEDSGLSEEEVLIWYCGVIGVERAPDTPDGECLHTRLGFKERLELVQMILREYHYRQLLARDSGDPGCSGAPSLA